MKAKAINQCEFFRALCSIDIWGKNKNRQVLKAFHMKSISLLNNQTHWKLLKSDITLLQPFLLLSGYWGTSGNESGIFSTLFGLLFFLLHGICY